MHLINAAGFFFSTAFVPTCLNSNIVTLILKIPGVTRVEDFRPIVLGNFLMKILTKIISMRIGPMLKHILSPSQYGFIPSKKIHHCIASSSEGMQCLSKEHGNMALKVDIKKYLTICIGNLSFLFWSFLALQTTFVALFTPFLSRQDFLFP